VAAAGLESYQKWLNDREKDVTRGERPEFEVLVVTEELLLRDPPERIKVEVEILERAEGRPRGARFGTLVHTVLRDVELGATREEVSRLSLLHGRLLQASPDELEAATEAVFNALKHPLVERAAQSAELHREYPFLARMPERKVIEGTVDLAFLEENRWILVDFKTDADLVSQQERYETQVRWYAYSLNQITGLEVEGFLLGI